MLAHVLFRDVTRQTVQIDRCENCLESALWILCQHSRDDTGKNVTSSTGCHTRISGGVYPYFTVWLGDGCAVAFQNQDQLMLAGKRPGNIDSVALNGCGAQTGE